MNCSAAGGSRLRQNSLIRYYAYSASLLLFACSWASIAFGVLAFEIGE